MDFIDEPPEISEQERFQRHNRFLRSLKSDTLLIIDNFNVSATQDSFLSVVLKYRCQISGNAGNGYVFETVPVQCFPENRQ